MSLLDKIPMPGTGFEGMMQGQELMQRFLMGPVERRHKEAQAKHQEAEAKRAEALANMPFGGHQLTGIAGQVMGLEMMKNLYGENSPQYQTAKNAFDLQQNNIEGLMDYRGSLQETLPKRTATTLAKEQMEMNDIKQGYLPGTNIPLDENQQKKLLGKYNLALNKKVTDSDTRKRNLFAKNVEITLDNINPADLVTYSGLRGTADLIQDEANAALGKTSDRYKKYKIAKTGSDTLVKQVRQFYGDSITPEIQAKLTKLANPSFWRSNPEVSLAQFNQFRKILDSEMRTYRRALESTEVYEKETNNELKNDNKLDNNNTLETNNEVDNERKLTKLEKKVGARLNQTEGRQLNNEEDLSMEGNKSDIEQGLITVIDPAGNQHKIFRDKLEAAQKKYPGLKVKKESFNAAKI